MKIVWLLSSINTTSNIDWDKKMLTVDYNIGYTYIHFNIYDWETASIVKNIDSTTFTKKNIRELYNKNFKDNNNNKSFKTDNVCLLVEPLYKAEDYDKYNKTKYIDKIGCIVLIIIRDLKPILDLDKSLQFKKMSRLVRLLSEKDKKQYNNNDKLKEQKFNKKINLMMRFRKIGPIQYSRTITTSSTKHKVDIDAFLDKTEKLFTRLTLNIKDIEKDRFSFNKLKKNNNDSSIENDDNNFTDYEDF